MKIEIKLAMIGLLSLLVGSAFASPLLMTELDPENIKPYLKPPSDVFTSSVTGEVLYANFSITPNSEKDSVFDLSYFVVINVTNTSDEPTNVTFVSFDAEVQDYSLRKTNSGGYSKSEAGRGWTAREAWVDGKHYNLTWVPNKEGFDYQGDPELEGEWIEGVNIYEHYINYKLAYTRINMNGTWVDVTGRIDVERPLYWPPTEHVMDATIISHIKSLVRETTFDTEGLDTPMIQRPPSGTPEEFNEVWGPHQSRLIVIKADRPVPSKYFESEKLEKLKTEEIVLKTIIQNSVTVDNWTDSAVSNDYIQVFFEVTDNGYQYSVLPEDTVFTLDVFGVEAFIDSRD
ncbi:MAG: hypothetical protein IAX21_02595 [Candidatus Bathyarchaeota archaeon]|nr:hypothetical protein [Candidatus Bathyarchaeum tardum]WGM90095.1 MAG: hypothetical protein NUK63_02980 [Candidatus Bathyarchaeum tardum]WNZ29767.1 MAG: hypothetical protein IAX21_02595 [Candidatus Bathyarchaeota archaeon]